ncbi:toxin-antitoxin system antidote component [Cyanobacterium sp. HL-69]|uniref:DUF2281 domain-containing protein n=1 Tax=Cyanobacterium sp. HL-69 TaxID=2054282 RepID=UPI000CA1750E|nr:toxin-antitoxin system antidote component [Cyanobacterium sp. HL-69]
MINIETKILETLGKMPKSLQEELLHYAEYLQEKYNQNSINYSSDTDVVNDFHISWHEAMTGQTIPVSQLWEGLEDDE